MVGAVPATGHQPRILIFGAGAVGTFLGARLQQAGGAVSLVGRAPHIEAVAKDGVRIRMMGKALNQPVEAAFQSVSELPGPFEYVLLTVKGYDTTAALDEIRPALQPGTILGSFQNGVGNEETIVSALPDQGLLAGSLTLPVTLEEPGQVRQHSRRGGVALAPVSPEVNVAPLVRRLGEAGFAARRYTDYRAMKWSKLLLNILVNAQSAILDLPPAQIVFDAELFRYERLAFREAVAVMHRLSIPVMSLPGFNVPLLAQVMALPAPLARLLLEPRLAGGRGTKMPSLWWDLNRGKGQTEARYLNGAVVDGGARRDVPTPVNKVLWAILEQVTGSPAEWDRYRQNPERLKALLRTAVRL
jgi:2-dehydropantoate 2-reductase